MYFIDTHRKCCQPQTVYGCLGIMKVKDRIKIHSRNIPNIISLDKKELRPFHLKYRQLCIRKTGHSLPKFHLYNVRNCIDNVDDIL